MIKFKAKHIIDKTWVHGHYAIIDQKSYIFSNDKKYQVNPNSVCQFLNFYDKCNSEIYVGDILKTYVVRSNYYQKNINHGGYYLNCIVLDILGNLQFNKDEIKELEKPKGREKYNQDVHHDLNLFNYLYYCKRHVLGKDGKPVRETKNGCENIKTYLDIELIGSVFDSDIPDDIVLNKYKIINELK